MAYRYKEGVPGERSGVYFRYSTDDPVFVIASLDGRVGVVVQSPTGPTDDVTILRDNTSAKKVYGTGGTTDIFKSLFDGGATDVYAVRLLGNGAKAGKINIPVLDKVERVILTKGTEKPGTAVETADATFDFKDNKLTVTFSNVPEGYNPSVRVKGQIGSVLAFVPGRFEDMSLSNGNKHIITYSPGAPINGEMTVEAVLTKDKITVLKSCTYTCEQKLDEEASEIGVIEVQSKFVGSREVVAQLKKDLKDPTLMNWKILENGEEIESLQFNVGEEDDQVATFIEVLGESTQVDVISKPENLKSTAVIQEFASLGFSGGKDGEITIQSYSDAFDILGKYRFASMVLDTVDQDVQALAKEFVNRCVDHGRFFTLTLGSDKKDRLSARIAYAKQLDDRNIVLVGPGYYDSLGNAVDDYLFAAQVGAMISSIPSSDSITYTQVKNAARMIANYTEDEYILCNQEGLVTITLDALDRLVIEKGVNTLHTLIPSIDDAGWKKIKRTKVRNEMMYRIEQLLTPYIGHLAPSDNNKSFIKGKIGQELDKMVAESKLAPVYTVEITSEIDEPDAFCYDIDVADYDSGEKYYLHYIFHYRVPETTQS